ncbi:MAG TPA: hypothetical protein VFT74_16120 [Isosphaeraceae bacterium]|nr:hypothetical protein [Isosphaeraceae bacterium]
MNEKKEEGPGLRPGELYAIVAPVRTSVRALLFLEILRKMRDGKTVMLLTHEGNWKRDPK